MTGDCDCDCDGRLVLGSCSTETAFIVHKSLDLKGTQWSERRSLGSGPRRGGRRVGIGDISKSYIDIKYSVLDN